jgi:AcrR family transcriptional regulator
MFDQFTPKGRILSAALDCAANKRWAEVNLLDIAQAAKLPLTEVREQFQSKSAILAGLLRAIDDEVIKRTKQEMGQEKRDALFDVIMTRFDVLTPYKAALKSVYASGPADPALAAPYLCSQHWMLEAAGIGTEGPSGALRVSGLGLIYASVFRVWLEDDDPGLARTMAALDRRLRRGERAIENVSRVASLFQRLGTEGPRVLCSLMRGCERPQASSDSGTSR